MTHTDKLCLITGATSGIGKAAAKALAQTGMRLVLPVRDLAKGRSVADEIQNAVQRECVDLTYVDLTSQASIRALVESFLSRHQCLDVLINNAGNIFGTRDTTADGIERTFALNHLAPFLLTNLLLDALKAASPSRIIHVGSGAEGWGRFDWNNLQGERKFDQLRQYGLTKLTLAMQCYELARRLQGTGVVVNVVHPGPVRTDLFRDMTPFLKFFVDLSKPFFRTVEQGADTIVYLATDPAMGTESGKFYYDRRTIKSQPISYDVEICRRLWEHSAKLVQLDV